VRGRAEGAEERTHVGGLQPVSHDASTTAGGQRFGLPARFVQPIVALVWVRRRSLGIR